MDLDLFKISELKDRELLSVLYTSFEEFTEGDEFMRQNIESLITLTKRNDVIKPSIAREIDISLNLKSFVHY